MKYVIKSNVETTIQPYNSMLEYAFEMSPFSKDQKRDDCRFSAPYRIFSVYKLKILLRYKLTYFKLSLRSNHTILTTVENFFSFTTC